MNLPSRYTRRKASVLLLVVFLMAITAPLIGLMLDAHTNHIRCIHNHIGGMTALYVAEAGVQDAMAQLVQNPAWRDGFTDKPFPHGLGHTYSVTVEDPTSGGILVTSVAHTAAGHTRTVTVCLSGF